ncbi:MAG: hypothetical protein HOP02_02585 [Methylococcaceae bacterium]|nr:hypothetical protein [Methylococcaceae bacterium]
MIKVKKVLQMGLGVLLLGCMQPIWAAGAVVKRSAPPLVTQIIDFSNIQDFAVATDGSLWVLDTTKILHLNADGKLIKQFGGGTDPLNIRKIALAADGSVWFFNEPISKIQHYSTDGAFISEFTLIGNNLSAADLQIAVDGSVWVLAEVNTNHPILSLRVQHYQTDGSLSTEFTHTEAGAEKKTDLLSIALDKDGGIWVSYTAGWDDNSPTLKRDRIAHFSADGQLIPLASDISSYSLNGIAVAADGSVWVADYSHVFKHYKADGTFIEKINSYSLDTISTSASLVKLAADGSLWTFSGSGWMSQVIRHMNSDGSVMAQFRNKSVCVTEYDDIQQTVYLWGVTVDQQSYDVVLQAQNDHFELVSNTPSNFNCTQSVKLENITMLSNFDASTNLLSIPSVIVAGIPFKATFKYLGDQIFTLQSAEKY